MAGMSEGILEEPTEEEEDMAIHIFNRDLGGDSNKSGKIDWNQDDYEGQVVDAIMGGSK